MSRSRRGSAIAAAAAIALVGAAPAGAGEFEATLTTLVSGRQDPRDDAVHTVVPIFELISVRATEVDNPWFEGLRVIAGGWVRVDPGEPADDELGTGDLNVAFVEGSLLDRRLRLRLGRQLVLGGAAHGLQHDGLAVDYRVWRKLGVEAYGGHPVTPRFVADRGDAVGGTRVYWKQAAETEFGASVIHLRRDGLIERQDVGLDGRYKVRRGLVATGHTMFSTVEARFAEVDVGLQWRKSDRFQISGDYRLTSPDLFLPRGSILSVFAENERHEAGVGVWLRPKPRLRFDVESYYLHVEEGSGARGRARGILYFGKQFETRVGSEVRLLHTPSNGYQRARVYASHQPKRELLLGLDADLYLFEESVNGFDWSFTGTASASYSLDEMWHATVLGVTGVTPFLERRMELMAKLTYGRVREVRKVLP